MQLSLLSNKHPLDHSCSLRETAHPVFFCIVLLPIKRPIGKKERTKKRETNILNLTNVYIFLNCSFHDSVSSVSSNCYGP
jgi:hypothetical protein